MNSYGGVVLVFLSSIAGCERSTTNEAAGDRGSTPVASSMPSSMPNMPNEAAEDAGAVDAADSGPAEDAGLPGAAAANHSEPLGPCPAEMAYLAAGSFKTGESGRRVSVTAFCLDKREVTVAHYMQCVKEKNCSPRCIEENRCSAVPVDTEWGDKEEDRKASRRCNGGVPGREDHPVNCISYEEAAAYCAAYGKRLPREEEWEWAVRGGEKAMRYPWGIFDAHAEELCWAKPHPGRPFKRSNTCVVGTHPLDTTPDGVQDMAGNVSEWVVGTSGGKTYPTLRGASFWAVDDGYVKASMWGFDSPAKRSEIFGVRCARDARLAEQTKAGAKVDDRATP